MRPLSVWTWTNNSSAIPIVALRAGLFALNDLWNMVVRLA